MYPTGLIATVLTVYLLYKAGYYGDMMMNFYYSVMSIYGWWNWSRKRDGEYVVPITRTNFREKIIGFGLFLLTMLVTYGVYRAFGREIEAANYIDIFTSGVFLQPCGIWRSRSWRTGRYGSLLISSPSHCMHTEAWACCRCSM